MGGHLTHGSPVNFSGKWFNVVPYGLGPDERIDYDEVERLAREHRPKMIIAGASAYPRIIDFERFGAIAAEVGAKLMVDMAHIAGLVATGAHPSPVPYADVVTSTTHKTLRGPRSGLILCKAEHQVAIDKAVFPGIQGGPLEHIIAAKAAAFAEAMQPEFKALHRCCRRERPRDGRGDGRGRPAARLGGYRQPPDARGPASCTGHRQGRREAARRGRLHGEQERHPERPGEPRSSRAASASARRR